MVEISKSGSGEGLGRAISRGYSTRGSRQPPGAMTLGEWALEATARGLASLHGGPRRARGPEMRVLWGRWAHLEGGRALG